MKIGMEERIGEMEGGCVERAGVWRGRFDDMGQVRRRIDCQRQPSKRG